jgi:2-dehydropantoate 2-reductase
MKVAIVGTGAMGSVYAALLAEGGHEVWAIDTWDAHLDAIAAHGLRVSGASGDRTVERIRVARTPGEAGACDTWVVATKASDVDAVMSSIAPLLRAEDVVMPFQNGLGAGERVARHVPESHVVLGIAEGFGSSIPEPGSVHHNGMRLIRIGELRGGSTARLRRLEQAWADAGFDVAAFTDTERMVWEKFICNVTLSAPTAAFDMTVGELMADTAAWTVALGCTMEAYRLGTAEGVAFGFEDPLRYVSEFAATIPDASPSMRLDHLAHRRSEVDVINGAVVQRSHAAGLAAPYNETLCAVLRAREATFPP